MSMGQIKKHCSGERDQGMLTLTPSVHPFTHSLHLFTHSFISQFPHSSVYS